MVMLLFAKSGNAGISDAAASSGDALVRQVRGDDGPTVWLVAQTSAAAGVWRRSGCDEAAVLTELQ